MEKDKKNINISDSEWKIMQILWSEPNLNLREIYDRVGESNWSYTTVRTLVTRLSEKGALDANRETAKNFRYYPAVSESECKIRETKSFLNRVFDGSAKMMMASLTKESNLTEKEQQELLSLIEKMENSQL